MSGVKAALYKDLKLFFSSAGVAALLLPFLLLLAFKVGLGDLTAQSYVQPFPIAVRDEDNTIMSRSLIAQMRRIELFSHVAVLEEESDRQSLDGGAAAVITIPKDFFYDLYTMSDCPVSIVLNQNMALESTLIYAIFGSVMDIIRGNQIASTAVYQLCYGPLDTEQQWALYQESSVHLLQDALGRQTVFENEAAQADLQGALERRLTACLLSVLALFFSIAAVKTLPEELGLGILPRYRALGGSTAAFVLSKFLVVCLLTLPTLLLTLAVFQPEHPLLFLALALLLLAAAFGILLGLAAWLGNPAAVQRWGNLLLFLSLVLGGTLWPRQLLPPPLPLLGRFTLPYYAGLGLEALAYGVSPGGLLRLLWPVPAMGAAGLLLAALLLRRRRAIRTAPAVPSVTSSPAEHPAPAPSSRPLPARLISLSAIKLTAMSGGVRGLTGLLAAALLCGLAASSVHSAGRQQLALAVCDQDQSALSQALVQRLSRHSGLSVRSCGSQEGEHLLLLGEVEGLLTIGSGYGQSLGSEEQLPLSYEGASAAVSMQGAREIIAGQVSLQHSRARAVGDAESHLGRPLSHQETARLQALMDEIEATMPPLYQMQTLSGAAAPLPFVPSQLSFTALMVLLTLLTAAAWAGGRDGRLVERRMGSLPFGRLLSYGSDCLALTGLGVLLSVCVLLFSGSVTVWTAAATLAYALCVAALSLMLTRFTSTDGRVDGLAPFLALILCLLGGCFMDLSHLSPALRTVSLLTPPGLALEASRGGGSALLALLCAALLFFVVGLRPRRR